jgi:alkylation response protein AidB-like acyl-CoA dehydrogenase
VIELEPSPRQERLGAEAVAFGEAHAPRSRVRELAERGAPADRDYLRGGAGLGWFSLLDGDPEAERLGLAEAAVVAEVRGRTLAPGPVVPMTVAAFSLGRSTAPPHRAALEAITGGDATASWAWADRRGHWAETPTVDAVKSPSGWVLNGASGLVQDGHQVDWLLVRASTGSGEQSFLVSATAPGLTRNRLDSLDLTRSWATVTFEEVAVVGDVAVDQGDPQAERQLLVAATLTVAEMVGTMDHLLSGTVQYAKDRMAFGRPIGAFQAIKHLLADASVAVETSTAMAAAAVDATDNRRPDAAKIVGMAKAFVGDAALEVANACWQTHGGVAYTWQHDFHLSLRRLTTDAALYGDPSFHRERLCRLHEHELAAR